MITIMPAQPRCVDQYLFERIRPFRHSFYNNELEQIKNFKFHFMKKLISISLFAILLCGFTLVQGQEKKIIKRDVKKVEHKTEELASKGKSKIVDKTYADKAGPDGQTIYIDKHSRYYWIDDKGKKVYTSKASLKNK